MKIICIETEVEAPQFVGWVSMSLSSEDIEMCPGPEPRVAGASARGRLGRSTDLRPHPRHWNKHAEHERRGKEQPRACGGGRGKTHWCRSARGRCSLGGRTDPRARTGERRRVRPRVGGATDPL